MEKSALARNEAQLATARAAYEKALSVKKAFMREKDKKTQEAMNAIRDARRAKWQAKVADAMESFQVAGIDATHDEMIRKVEEQTAVNEARMEMALESVRPFLHGHGGDVLLLELDAARGAVPLQLLGSCDGCPSSAVTLRTAVETAIEDAAPEIIVIDVEEPAADAGLTTPVELGRRPAVGVR